MMLGARTGAWAKSGGGVPTARDYVQDGLVAMWDGIENAGWGLHDENYGGWVNLVTGNDATLLTGTLQFDSSSAVFDGGTNLVVPNVDFAPVIAANNAGDIEIDAVFKVTLDTPTNAVSVAGAEYVLLTMINFFHTGYPYNGNQSSIRGNNANIKLTGGSEIIPLYSWNKDGLVWAEDKRYGSIGSKAQGSSNLNETYRYYLGKSWNAGKYLTGNIYCMRHYSRALTDEERAHNYAIDKARFNLP